jgi:phospholipid/cholesterol/gamma-HCH transport system permease protein
MSDGSARVSFRRDPDGGVAIVLGGSWRLAGAVPQDGDVRAALDPGARVVRFEAGALGTWDSALVSYIAGVSEVARERHIPVDRGGLPGGVRRLLALAEAGPARALPSGERPPSWLARVGLRAERRRQAGAGALAFVGDATVALARMAVGRARFRRRELFSLIQACGAQALGIVGLVSFLVGLILAFVGSIQLQTFGATLYVADLVGISIVREMGAVMAAIVVAGRTGAAYAAELGTMRVTQEIDALATLGISPVEFLVAPRIVAVALMLPFLCLYADLLGVLGGAVVGVTMIGIGPRVYYEQTIQVLTTSDLLGGVFKAAVYGALVAGAGCFEGLRSGRSAGAVGLAATRAVVDGIVLVIVACGVFAAMFYVLGI